MLSWGQIKGDFELEPVIREKFRNNGNGAIADIVTTTKSRGLPAEIVWDEGEIWWEPP